MGGAGTSGTGGTAGATAGATGPAARLRPVVHTVGHGARPVAALIATLEIARVTVVIDIRRYPMSRRHPQFNQEALAGALGEAGVRYEWQGEPLGGRRSRRSGSRHTALRHPAFAGYADHMDTTEFRAAVDALVARAETGERPAIMCAETLWWQCHRMLVADALAIRGAEVVHLIDVTQVQAYRPHATMRTEEGWPVYDVPDTLPGLD